MTTVKASNVETVTLIEVAPKRVPKAGDAAMCRYWGLLWTGVLHSSAGSTMPGDLTAIRFNPHSAPTNHWPHREPEVWIDSVEYYGEWNDMLQCWVCRASAD